MRHAYFNQIFILLTLEIFFPKERNESRVVVYCNLHLSLFSHTTQTGTKHFILNTFGSNWKIENICGLYPQKLVNTCLKISNITIISNLSVAERLHYNLLFSQPIDYKTRVLWDWELLWVYHFLLRQVGKNYRKVNCDPKPVEQSSTY